MKTIENKGTELTVNGKEYFYFDLIKVVLDNPPLNGWTTTEMKERLLIEGKIDNKNPGEKVKLENSEFNKILELSDPSTMIWGFKHKDIVSFRDYLEEVSKQKD